MNTKKIKWDQLISYVIFSGNSNDDIRGLFKFQKENFGREKKKWLRLHLGNLRIRCKTTYTECNCTLRGEYCTKMHHDSSLSLFILSFSAHYRRILIYLVREKIRREFCIRFVHKIINMNQRWSRGQNLKSVNLTRFSVSRFSQKVLADSIFMQRQQKTRFGVIYSSSDALRKRER